MALRINTNVAALNAHKNMTKTDNALSGSLEKLSSGLRINKAADDASGMSIADSLKSQSMGLGQAIRNANDGINIVQTADAALEESINIVNTIKTKAIQAAQDGQTTESRKAIQSDITKLMEELDMIAKTTSFNNQKLLSGNFTNKAFQVGAYSGETVSISIASSESTKVGHVMSSRLGLANDEAGVVDISVFSNLQNQNYNVEAISVEYNNSSENSMSAVADAINKLSDSLGISATAIVESTTDVSIAAGTTDEDFAINGVAIGQVQVSANDTDGALAKAINNKTSEHGVVASVDSDGYLTLTSTDGRAIEVATGAGTGTQQVLGDSDMSTVGYVQMNQTGSNEIIVNDTVGGNVVTLTNDLDIETSAVSETESKVAAGSILAKDTILGAGWTTGQNVYGDKFDADITTSEESLLTAGSVIACGSTVATNGRLAADMVLQDTSTATQGTGSLLTDSTLTSGSVLGIGTTVAANNTITGATTTIQATTEATVGDSTVASGSVLGAGTTIGANTSLSGMSNVSVAETEATTGDSTISSGSTLGKGTILASSTTMNAKAILEQTDTTTGDSTVGETSVLAKGTVLGAGTVIVSSGAATADGAKINQTEATTGASLLRSGSTLTAGTVIGAGTVIDSGLAAGSADLAAYMTAEGLDSGDTLLDDYTLTADATLGQSAGFGTTLNANSIIANGSELMSGSYVAADITLSEDLQLSGGTTMTAKIGSSFAVDTQLGSGSTVAADVTLKAAMSIAAGAGITAKAGTVLGENSVLQSGSSIAADITLVSATTLLNNQNITAKTGTTFGDNTTFEGGSKIAADITLSAASTISGTMTLTGDMTVGANSQFVTGSTLEEGSDLTTSFKLSGHTTLNSDMTLGANSIIDNDAATLFKAGSKIGGQAKLDSLLTVQADMTIGAGSKLLKGTTLANGSTLGGAVTLAKDETVAAGTQMELAGGSILEAGSKIAAGTYLTNDITTADGVVKAGTELKEDITTTGVNTLRNQMTLAGGSVIAAKSTLAANAEDSDAATTEMTNAQSNRLSDLSVLDQESAQIAIAVADAALKDLDKVRADLGSVQNQLTSTISNISTTKVNVDSAESSIRDVDFAEEASNFTKLQILAQAGTFAMSQANASSQNVLSLLQ